MKQFWNKYKEVIVIVGFAAAVFALVYFVAKPISKEISVKRDDIQEELLSQQNKKNKIASIPAYREQAQRVSEEGKKMQVFVSKESAVTLIEKIEESAQETDVMINIKINENSQPKIPAKKTTTKKKEIVPKTLVEELPNDKYLQLNITFSGDYKRIANFLHKIETMEYMNDVISLQIEKVEENSKGSEREQSGTIGAGNENEKKEVSTGTLQASMNVVFYLQPE